MVASATIVGKGLIRGEVGYYVQDVWVAQKNPKEIQGPAHIYKSDARAAPTTNQAFTRAFSHSKLSRKAL
jgi:hypothetical protein